MRITLLIKCGHPPRVANVDGFQHIAEVVDRKRQAMTDTGVRGIPFIVIVKRFAFIGVEDSVPVRANRLQTCEPVIKFRHAIRQNRFVASVIGEDFSPQNVAFKGARGLAQAFVVEIRWKCRTRQKYGLGVPGEIFVVCWVPEIRLYARPIDKCTGVKPDARHGGRQIECVRRIRRDSLGVALLHVSKTAEFAFDPVKIAVTITIGRNQRRVGDEIARFYPRDYVNWKWHSG